MVIAVCLALGAIAATTAYSPPLSLADNMLVGLTLNAPAGIVVDGPDVGSPLYESGTKLTPDVLAILRGSGVHRVRVNRFSLARWSGKWLFLGSVVGLLLGAVLVRQSARVRIAAAGKVRDDAGASPESALEGITRTVDGLRSQLPGMSDRQAGLAAIVERIGEAQLTDVAAFVDARAELTARFGLAGFAALMDRFAAAERQINRAWSAAADDAYDESVRCLDRAATLLEQTKERFEA